tara:strand:- start:6043 stop:7341 length:1299 start_codon:yes stop_codon:yes gene_type:complete
MIKSEKAKLILQFNEANFDIISKYTEKYDLNGFKKLFSISRKVSTNSEVEYKYLEPWIQWYSFYSGKEFHKHGVFHLGDCLNKQENLFCEDEAKNGKKVGIFGSMNMPPSKYYKIYIPDAWTRVNSDKSLSSRFVSNTMSKIINSNANLTISFSNILGMLLLIGFPRKITDFKMIFKSFFYFIFNSRESLASIFDYFFVRYSIKRMTNSKLNLAIIFLNGLAHVQHHYLLSSEFVKGNNPWWYVKNGSDPIYKSLKIYNQLFEVLLKDLNNKTELWIVTGLTQTPHVKPVFYWRFRDHKNLLNQFLNLNFSVNPKMSRDFEIKIDNPESMQIVEHFLKNAKILTEDGHSNAFDFIDKIDSKTIFSSFVYAKESKKINLEYNDVTVPLENLMDFVAIKNGKHDQRGWVFTNSNILEKKNTINLWDLQKYISSI